MLYIYGVDQVLNYPPRRERGGSSTGVWLNGE